MGEPTESVWHTLSLDDLGHATVCEKRRVVGVFTEGMELKKFPFDSQVNVSYFPKYITIKSS